MNRGRIILLLAFALTAATHVCFRSHVFVPNSDDLLALVDARVTGVEGWEGYARDARVFAEGQGRFFWFATTWFRQAPYLIEDATARAIVLALVHALAGLLIGVLLERWSGRRGLATIFLLLFAFAIPAYPGWHGYHHHPLVWSVPLILFALAQLLYLRLLGASSRARWLLVYPAYLLLLFAAISFWEMFFFTFGVCCVIAAIVVGVRRPEPGRSWIDHAKRLALPAPAFLVYLVAYIGFKARVPGNRVDTALSTSFDPVEIVRATAVYLGNGVPLAPEVWTQARRWLRDGVDKDPLTTIGLGVMMIVVAAVAARLCLLAIPRDGDGDDGGAVPPRGPGRLLAACAACLVVSVAFLALHVITARYQVWWREVHPWYTPTFHASIGIVAMLALLLHPLLRRAAERARAGRGRVPAEFLVATLAAALTVGAVSYLGVRMRLERGAIFWVLCDQMGGSAAGSMIRAGDVVVAPELVKRTPGRGEKDLRRTAAILAALLRDPGLADRIEIRPDAASLIPADGSAAVTNVVTIEAVNDHSNERAVLRVARIDRLERRGGVVHPLAREVAIVPYRRRAGRFVDARAWGAEGTIDLGDEPVLRRHRDVLLARFRNPVLVETVCDRSRPPDPDPLGTVVTWRDCRRPRPDRDGAWRRACDESGAMVVVNRGNAALAGTLRGRLLPEAGAADAAPLAVELRVGEDRVPVALDADGRLAVPITFGIGRTVIAPSMRREPDGPAIPFVAVEWRFDLER